MREYHPKIAARIEAARAMPTERCRERFDVHTSLRFVLGARIYCEVTFSPARTGRASSTARSRSST